jgi:zinc protease
MLVFLILVSGAMNGIVEVAGAAVPLPAQVAPPAPPSGVERVTSVEGITEYRLNNGLRLLLFPDQSRQTATVNVTYMVGSRYEGYGETGMAHLLEHLMFKGSTGHTNIPQELSEHGSRPNGTTSFDRTNYFETFPASNVNLEWAIRLEADRMVNSFIARKDLDSEMTVVRNEYEAGENSTVEVTLKRLQSAAYDWHNYSKPPIGTPSDLENVPIERLQAFYHMYYQPDNAVLLVAGKFDPARALELVAVCFGPIPRPTRTLPATYTVEPTQDGERTAVVRRAGDSQAALVGYHQPSGYHPDAAALSVLSFVLGDTPSGRLYKALVEPKKAAAVYSFDFQRHDPGMMIFGALVGKGASLDAARDAMLATIEGIAETQISAEEVERARAYLLKEIDLTLSSSEQVGLRLSDWIGMGDWRLFFIHRDKLKSLKLVDVQRVAARYLKPSNRTVALFIPSEKPDRAVISPSPDLTSLVKDYRGGAEVAAGEAFDPSPASIDAHTRIVDLPGGLRLALLQKKTRASTVVFRMTLSFGDQKALTNRSTAAWLASQMLMRGTAKHSRQQLQDELDRLKARAAVFGRSSGVSVSVETVRESLPAVLSLIAEVLREPAFSTAEFDQLKNEQITFAEQQLKDPQALASSYFSRHMSPYLKGDPRYIATLEEQIAETRAASLEDARKFYADFYGASNAQLAIVGDFDDVAMEKLVAALFGSWKSPRPFSRLVAVYQDIPAINQSLETPDKANAFFVAGTRLNLRDDDPDYPALTLGNYMLGGGLHSRLATRLRQKDGLSYGIRSSVNASSLDSTGQFGANAIYAPQNAEKVESAFKEELTRVLKDGFTLDEVAAAKSGYLQSRLVSRSQDQELASRLVSNLSVHRTFAWDADFDTRIAALTPHQIVEAFRRHLDPSRMTIIKAGDFARTLASEKQ